VNSSAKKWCARATLGEPTKYEMMRSKHDYLEEKREGRRCVARAQRAKRSFSVASCKPHEQRWSKGNLTRRRAETPLQLFPRQVAAVLWSPGSQPACQAPPPVGEGWSGATERGPGRSPEPGRSAGPRGSPQWPKAKRGSDSVRA
jgi:hypothetical protein